MPNAAQLSDSRQPIARHIRSALRQLWTNAATFPISLEGAGQFSDLDPIHRRQIQQIVMLPSVQPQDMSRSVCHARCRRRSVWRRDDVHNLGVGGISWITSVPTARRTLPDQVRQRRLGDLPKCHGLSRVIVDSDMGNRPQPCRRRRIGSRPTRNADTPASKPIPKAPATLRQSS